MKQENPFEKMSMMTLENRGLAALGGRVGFQDGHRCKSYNTFRTKKL